MTSALIAVTELQARALAVDTALAELRVEIERDRDFVTIWCYQWRARRAFSKLQRALIAHRNGLSAHQLNRVADLLEMSEVLNPYEGERHALRFFERPVYRKICSLKTEVESTVESLRRQALVLRESSSSPRLSPYQARQAAFTNAFLRRVATDPAERLADPDYGF